MVLKADKGKNKHLISLRCPVLLQAVGRSTHFRMPQVGANRVVLRWEHKELKAFSFHLSAMHLPSSRLSRTGPAGSPGSQEWQFENCVPLLVASSDYPVASVMERYIWLDSGRDEIAPSSKMA